MAVAVRSATSSRTRSRPCRYTSMPLAIRSSLLAPNPASPSRRPALIAAAAGEIGRGPAVSTVQLEVGAMEVSYHPFGIEETGELAQVKLAGGLQRRQAGRLGLLGGALDEAQVGELVVDDLGAADRAVTGHQGAGAERAQHGLEHLDPAADRAHQRERGT